MGSKSSYRLDLIAQKAYEDLYKKREEDVKGIKEIDVSDLESGVYYVKIGDITKKLIIE